MSLFYLYCSKILFNKSFFISKNVNQYISKLLQLNLSWSASLLTIHPIRKEEKTSKLMFIK